MDAVTEDADQAFSILERIVGVETVELDHPRGRVAQLSVSSNGSLGLKLIGDRLKRAKEKSFSILERIVGVETCAESLKGMGSDAFSILERIVGVETERRVL